MVSLFVSYGLTFVHGKENIVVSFPTFQPERPTPHLIIFPRKGNASTKGTLSPNGTSFIFPYDSMDGLFGLKSNIELYVA